jgi:hypothetical protein
MIRDAADARLANETFTDLRKAVEWVAEHLPYNAPRRFY